MSHIVIYRSADGQPVFHQAESLEEAARQVERLRNAAQGPDARIFRLHEVPIEVKTYYRVEVSPEGDKGPQAAPPVPATPPASEAAPPAPPEPPVSAPVAVVAVKPEPSPSPASVNGGRFGLFGKG